MTDAKRDTVPPVAAELSVHADEHAQNTEVVAEQGPPPADHAQRPASGVKVHTGEGLSAEQVAAMTGATGEATDANVELQEAQGLDATTQG